MSYIKLVIELWLGSYYVFVLSSYELVTHCSELVSQIRKENRIRLNTVKSFKKMIN